MKHILKVHLTDEEGTILTMMSDYSYKMHPSDSLFIIIQEGPQLEGTELVFTAPVENVAYITVEKV